MVKGKKLFYADKLYITLNDRLLSVRSYKWTSRGVYQGMIYVRAYHQGYVTGVCHSQRILALRDYSLSLSLTHTHVPADSCVSHPSHSLQHWHEYQAPHALLET